ncbi:MAG: stage II sporulation protein R [Ruminococcaceae bacterium]|nr:stage II sporulation protein R [Oscillospiraceae bacterium]
MNKFRTAIIFSLIFSVCLSFARFDALCQDVRDNVFRLHIRANSNSEFDQALKLKVRDAILLFEGEHFGECENLDSAIEYAENNIENFKNIAQNIIKEQGYDYEVTVSVGDSYFENREYEDFTLPAGVYKSLNIDIGSGEGKNWWCVMFPAVCVGSAADIEDALNSSSAEIVTNSRKYTVKFKSVEVYEDIKKIFSKNKK